MKSWGKPPAGLICRKRNMTPYKISWNARRPKTSPHVIQDDRMESQVALTIVDSMAMNTLILFALSGKSGLAPLWWTLAGAGFVKMLHDASEISL